MIYLDHNATTPVLPEAVEAMMPWLTEQWGNPSSVHGPGRMARKAVEEAREWVAALTGAEPFQVIFTSGATEANNAAIHSTLLRAPTKRHIVTSTVEHSAVLAYCEHLEIHHGVEVTRLPVDANGSVSLEDLRSAIRPDTALVSLIWANNESGVIWPVAEFAQTCSEKGVPFHTDAVQAVGKISVKFEAAGADFLSLSGHKFGAPKGIGALIVADPDQFVPFVVGGKQESGRRGGTENVAAIVAIGKAAQRRSSMGLHVWDKIATLRNDLESSIASIVPGCKVNGGSSQRLPNTSNLYLPGIDADALIIYLDQQGICVSSGSACLESAINPSHVIAAMTGSHEMASESVRISLGVDTTPRDLCELVDALANFLRFNSWISSGGS